MREIFLNFFLFRILQNIYFYYSIWNFMKILKQIFNQFGINNWEIFFWEIIKIYYGFFELFWKSEIWLCNFKMQYFRKIVIIKVMAFLFLRINKLIQIFYRGKKNCFQSKIKYFFFFVQKNSTFSIAKKFSRSITLRMKILQIFQYQIYSSECLVEFISNFSLS